VSFAINAATVAVAFASSAFAFATAAFSFAASPSVSSSPFPISPSSIA
jgi:hypothetical protein